MEYFSTVSEIFKNYLTNLTIFRIPHYKKKITSEETFFRFLYINFEGMIIMDKAENSLILPLH